MNAPTTAVAVRSSSLMDPTAFEHMQRVGRVLALSPLFPEHLRKGSVETGIANGVLVLNMATRLNEDVLTVAQNIYFVGGKPGWSASYMIGKANQHGVFRDPIDWDVKGQGDGLSVTAFAVLSATGKRVAVTCDMKMAKAEGWTNNKKYQSMPEQMLRYRSGTFLIRLYCPEVMIGVPSTIELELGMKDVTPDYVPPEAESAMAEVPAAEIITGEGEVVPQADKAKPKPAPAAEQAGLPLGDPKQAEDSGSPADEVEARWAVDLRKMRADFDSSGADAVRDLWADHLEKLKDEAPHLHAALMAEMGLPAE
jgi:hypothetical protein